MSENKSNGNERKGLLTNKARREISEKGLQHHNVTLQISVAIESPALTCRMKRDEDILLLFEM